MPEVAVSLLVAALVGGLILAAVTFVIWVFVLPFQLLGLFLKGLGFLLVLPFLLIFLLLGVLLFGVGALVLLFPILPFVAIAYVLWRLLRRRSSATPAIAPPAPRC